jgi:single-strand DNA-binding protein
MPLAAPMTIAGNLTADPELRYTKSNKPVASFTIAMTPTSFNQSTKKYEDGETLFMRCSLWDDAAEHAAQSLKKGDRVIAYGQVKSRTYQDREGTTKTSIEMVVEELGASLKYATMSPQKGDHRKGASAPAQNDGWTTVDDDTPF